jgi:hypothetical protein
MTAMSEYMIKYIRTELSKLYRAASNLDGWNKEQALEFINVGEYGLALDGIAYAYLVNGKNMPADLFRIFDKLAVSMDMEGDEEFEGVARLRAGSRHA